MREKHHTAFSPLAAQTQSSSENQPPHPIQHHQHRYYDPRQLQHSHLVPLTCHHAQPPRAPLDGGRHGGEGLGGAVDDALLARIVVDVDGDAAELAHFGAESGEGVVVLSEGWVRLGSVRGGGGLTFLARRLRTFSVVVGGIRDVSAELRRAAVRMSGFLLDAVCASQCPRVYHVAVRLVYSGLSVRMVEGESRRSED